MGVLLVAAQRHPDLFLRLLQAGVTDHQTRTFLEGEPSKFPTASVEHWRSWKQAHEVRQQLDRGIPAGRSTVRTRM